MDVDIQLRRSSLSRRDNVSSQLGVVTNRLPSTGVNHSVGTSFSSSSLAPDHGRAGGNRASKVAAKEDVVTVDRGSPASPPKPVTANARRTSSEVRLRGVLLRSSLFRRELESGSGEELVAAASRACIRLV